MKPVAGRVFVRRSVIAAPLACALACGLAWPAAARQPEASAPEPEPAAEPAPAPVPGAPAEREVRYQISFAGLMAFNTEFEDDQGDLTVYRSGVGVGAAVPIGERASLDVSLDYELSSYQFEDATGFIEGTDDPFESVHRVSLSALYGVQRTERWGWFAGGNATSAGEEGADFGESLTGGVLGGVRYKLSENVTVGLGAAVRTRLEESPLVLPVVQLDWKISDRWSLSTAGQPGLTLGYTPVDAWTFTLGGGWEFRNFRLDEDGPLPDGVVAEHRFPVALGAVWRATPQLSITGAVGAYFGQSFEVSDEDGDEVADLDADTTPFLVLKATYSF